MRPRRLRSQAPDLRGITMSNIVRLALREYVETHAPAETDAAQDEEAKTIRARGLGWDITDYGQDDFDTLGLFLFTTRNGALADSPPSVPAR